MILAITAEADALVPSWAWGVADGLVWLLEWVHPTRYQEMLGIVEAINDPNYTISKVAMFNVYADMASFCTSIVA